MTLMMLSLAGNEVLGGGGPNGAGSRFKSKDEDFALTNGIGFRGYGNRGVSGYLFDTVDAVLAFQGKPTASLSDFAYSGLTGRAVTGHSLGTLDASFAVSHGLATRAEIYAIPFGNVAPPASNIRLGNFDPVNGGFLGHLFNWGSRACGIGVNHALTTYLQSGC